MAKPEYANTQAEAAEKLGISRATFVEMARHSDFPKRSKRGYSLAACRKFMEKHGRGPHRRGSGGKTTSIGGVTLTEANIKRTIEQAENERIKKEIALVEQAKQIGEVMFLDEVRKLYLQTVSTVIAVHDSVFDAVDRAMPESCPTPAAWKEIRERVMVICRKLQADAASAMEELTA